MVNLEGLPDVVTGGEVYTKLIVGGTSARPRKAVGGAGSAWTPAGAGSSGGNM